MRLLITGMHGTVGPRLGEHARRAGHDVVAWDRAQVPPEDEAGGERLLAGQRPDAIVHLAFGAEAWAGRLADAARRRGIPMVYTSTAMVFAQRPDGPHTITSARTAVDDYGAYKIRCEDAVMGANPEAMVARLAYQVDPHGGGNNLVAHLDARAASGGRVEASTRWIPALAMLDDTAAALLSLVEHPEPGVHHLDANAEPAWTHHQVVTALAAWLGRSWQVVATEDPEHDQRLLGSVRVPSLATRIPLPPGG